MDRQPTPKAPIVPVLQTPPASTRYEVVVEARSQVSAGPWRLGPGRYRIGRDPRCALQVDCGYLSRQHVELEVMESGGVLVCDLGSTNGTWLNGEPVERRAQAGDFELQIGPVRLQFRELHPRWPDAAALLPPA